MNSVEAILSVNRKLSYQDKLAAKELGPPRADLLIEKVTKTSTSSEDLNESVEQLRARLDAMKKLIDDPDKKVRKRLQDKNSIIDGSFLSVVFTVVLLMIIAVSCYAFMNLYYAIVKKFNPKPHTEL